MGRFAGMIMVLILVGQDIALLVEASNKNKIEKEGFVAVSSPSMPPDDDDDEDLFSANYDARFRVPAFLSRRASGILNALKERGIRCADPMNVIICHQMFTNYQLFSACMSVSVAWCLRKKTNHIFACTLGCAHSINTLNARFDVDTIEGYVGTCYNSCKKKNF